MAAQSPPEGGPTPVPGQPGPAPEPPTGGQRPELLWPNGATGRDDPPWPTEAPWAAVRKLGAIRRHSHLRLAAVAPWPLSRCPERGALHPGAGGVVCCARPVGRLRAGDRGCNYRGRPFGERDWSCDHSFERDGALDRNAGHGDLCLAPLRQREPTT